MNILRIIADFSLGIIATYDTENCDESIIKADHTKLFQPPEDPYYLQHYINCHLTMIQRMNRQQSFIIIAKATLLRIICFAINVVVFNWNMTMVAMITFILMIIHHYYNMCPGTYGYIMENDGFETQTPCEDKLCNEYVACNSCFRNIVVLKHEEQLKWMDIIWHDKMCIFPLYFNLDGYICNYC